MNEQKVLAELQFTREQFPDLDLYPEWQVDFDAACNTYLTKEAGQIYNGSISRKVNEQRTIFAGLGSFVGDGFEPVQELSTQQLAELQLEEKDEEGTITQEAGTFRQNLPTYLAEAKTAREQAEQDDKDNIAQIRDFFVGMQDGTFPANQRNWERLGRALQKMGKILYTDIQELQ